MTRQGLGQSLPVVIALSFAYLAWRVAANTRTARQSNRADLNPLKQRFLSKRSPMGRDLVTRPYGRFYCQPRHLAGLGSQVTLLLLDYHNDAPIDMRRDGIPWISEPLVSRMPLVE